MAINVSDYLATKHEGIAVHKKDENRFLIRYYIKNKRTMKIWKANSVHGKVDKLKNAYAAREKLIADALKQNGTNADMSSTVGAYFCKLYRRKLKLKRKRNRAKTMIESKEGWSKDVAKGYKGFYRNYIRPVIGHMKIVDVKPMHISKINEGTAGFAPRTRKTAFEILIPLFEQAVEDEIIIVSPILKKHRIKRSQKQEKRVIQGDAVLKYKAIHKAIHTVFQDNPHHRALFLFGFNGRRKTETLRLKWEDINFTDGTYVIVAENSKVGIDMTFKMSDDIKAALEEFRDVKGNVFHITWISDAVKKIRDEAKIPEFTFHWMRNLSVSALSASGVDSAYLSGMLGHTDLNTVKQYLTLQNKKASEVTNEAARRILL